MRPAFFFLLLTTALHAQTGSTMPMTAGERKVDGKLSPSLQPVEDVPGLPRVLLIGDSISMGYTLSVRARLQGVANVHRPPTNCGPTTKGLTELDQWLGPGRWDVIHFNFGLHDLKYVRPGVLLVPLGQYEDNLRVLAARLERTGAKLIWATTTPVPEKLKAGQYPRLPADVARYNAAAARVIAGSPVVVDDLYALAEPRLSEWQNPMDVHFNRKGSEALAEQVASSIREVLSGAGNRTAEMAEPRITEVEPRVWACEFKSRALGGSVQRFLVVLPEGVAPGAPPQPVIYFLHGRGRHERTLLENAVTRPRVLAARCAVVLPRGREGWYINSPVLPSERFADYVDEVIRLAEAHFPVSREPARRAIGGWSMGGYGAAYTAGRRPGDFAAVASLIGILDFPRLPIADPGQNYTVPPRFGADSAFWATVNPRLLLRGMRGTPFFVAYATGAPERQMNEAFITEARALGMEPEVVQLSGGHTFPIVEASLDRAFTFLERHVEAGSPP